MYQTFTRYWFKADGTPGPSHKTIYSYWTNEKQAREECKEYNDNNDPGPRSKKMEYERV